MGALKIFSLLLVFSIIPGCTKSNDPEKIISKIVSGNSEERIAKVTGNLDEKRIQNKNGETANWLTHGRTYTEQRFAPINQITTRNIKDLGLAWFWDTNTSRGLEATPILVDGIMFTTGAWSVVWAHDAKTGSLLWSYDPKVPKAYGKYACCDVVNRGVAVWKGRVYSGTLDGRLIALNAATGELDWQVQTTDKSKPYTITGAPRVVEDKVIIGNGGGEYGVRGYVSAYDASNGAQIWRFYTVPGDPSKPYESAALAKAGPTWRAGEAKYWEIGGGGTVWDSIAYDPELRLLYVGVGNGSPWSRFIRSPGGGDNLYLSSILALDPENGELIWHYQTTPGDSWDYTATQHMILADIEIYGETRKVLMQAPKNGFFYVIDRVNGELISAQNYVPVTWATHIDLETGKPVENPETNYADEAKLTRPGPLGGHNWQPMSYNPDTGLVYIPVMENSFTYSQDNSFQYEPGQWSLGVDTDFMIPDSDPNEILKALKTPPVGHLAAWDPINQKEVWRAQHTSAWNGGSLTTSGNLVFQGLADGRFVAYDATTGELVWEYPVNIGIMAAPISYSIDGEQYIAVLAGWGGAFGLSGGIPKHRNNVLSEGRILAFKLGGSQSLPDPELSFIEIPEPPNFDFTANEVAAGASLYSRYCAVCHGIGLISSSGGTPTDLRYTSEAAHKNWDAIVLGGLYANQGMVGFADVLDASESKAIHSYILQGIRESIALCKSDYRKQYPELLDTACTLTRSGPQ